MLSAKRDRLLGAGFEALEAVMSVKVITAPLM